VTACCYCQALEACYLRGQAEASATGDVLRQIDPLGEKSKERLGRFRLLGRKIAQRRKVKSSSSSAMKGYWRRHRDSGRYMALT